MVRIINIILSALCIYLSAVYLRAKQCQQKWNKSLPLKTYFWTGREPTWDPEKKTSTLDKAGFTSVVVTTTTDLTISSIEVYQVAREATNTIKRTTGSGAHTMDSGIPATTKFVDPRKPPRCFRAFGKDWR